MKKEKDKNPARYGITPSAFIDLGWLILIGVVAGVAGLSRLIGWVIHSLL